MNEEEVSDLLIIEEHPVDTEAPFDEEVWFVDELVDDNLETEEILLDWSDIDLGDD